MFENILFWLIIWLISFFPIVLWGYVFSYIDNSVVNKKRFLVWVLWWVLSVIPILYMDKIGDLLHFPYINSFYFASQIQNFFTSMQFWASLSLFFAFVVICSFLFWVFVHKWKNIITRYTKNILTFLLFIVWLSLAVFLINFVLSWIDMEIKDTVAFWDVIFNSLKLIIFYYVIVAFIEEASKHFNFLQSSSLQITSIQQWVLYAIFVALGFAFIENILYFSSSYNQNWFSSDFMKIYFYRSTFAVIVHVLCSSVVAFYFTKALLLYREKELSFPYLKIFLFGLSFWVWLHLLFDVALSLGFTFIMFLYFIGWYLYVSSIFYTDED